MEEIICYKCSEKDPEKVIWESCSIERPYGSTGEKECISCHESDLDKLRQAGAKEIKFSEFNKMTQEDKDKILNS